MTAVRSRSPRNGSGPFTKRSRNSRRAIGAPLVLCDLEGRTHEQAARSLGWPVGTVKSRQARGRARLRQRLTRRGLAPSVGALASGLAADSSAVTIPSALVTSTVRAGCRFGSGKSGVGTIAANVATLTRGALTAMLWKKLKLASLISMLAMGVCTEMAVLIRHALAVEPARQAAGEPPTSDQASGRADPVPSGPMLSGTVLDAVGQPAEGAEVLLIDGYRPLDPYGEPMWMPGNRRYSATLRGQGRTDLEGRFQFEVRGEPIDAEDRVALWAYRPGAGGRLDRSRADVHGIR